MRIGKLTHPLGAVKGGSTRPPGRVLHPPPAPGAAAPVGGGVQAAVKALAPSVQLSKLSAMASNTDLRNPINGK